MGFEENLAPAELKDKWGYIDKDGNFIIQPQYDQPHKFSNERALVKIGTKWGVINQIGKLLVKPKFCDADFFREGLCPVKEGENGA